MKALLLLLAACWFTSCHSNSEMSPPNIILIMADDLGYETLSINGSTSYKTPHLDRLAKEGMRFTNAYSTPLCTPSRVQLMTGKYNFRNYVGFGILNSSERTFGHYLQQKGYRTAVFGKWQLYGNKVQRDLVNRTGTLPENAGFDEHYLWQVQEKTGSRFKDPHIVKQGSASIAYPGAYGPDIFADSLIGFMKRTGNHPFFAYYPMVLTHDPFQPTPSQVNYQQFDSSERLNDPAYFSANVEYMDSIIGRINKALLDQGIEQNTLLLFIGDNGTDRDVTSGFQGNQIKGHKGYPTVYGTHVPMIAHWPGTINEGQVNDNLIDFTDFLPTLLDIAGIKNTENTPLDGVSFYPQLTGDSFTARQWIYCYYAPNWGNFESREYIQDKSWKLFANGEFYDINQDPYHVSPLTEESLPASVLQRKNELASILEGMREEN